MGLSKNPLNLLQAGAFVNKWRQRPAHNYDCLPLILRVKRGDNLLVLPLIIALILLLSPVNAIGSETNYPRELQELTRNGAYGLARDTTLLAANNLDAPLVPASTIKILTALAAFDQLGREFQFKTEFFVDGDNHLYIKGYGDPFLVSEEIATIMLSLQKSGVGTINDIYIDDSSYQLEDIDVGAGNSLNPYDVQPSALAVNFNTINIVVDKDNSVRSGEPQTPLLPIMTRLGKHLPPGKHRINISGDPADALLLAGQLFRNFQKKAGINGSGRIGHRKVVGGKPALVYYSSRKLPELIAGLMLYSNNFIANQIFLQIGVKQFGYPATWQKGQRAMADFIGKDPILAATAIKMVEGSGLSRENRLTIRAMLRILELFKPHARLLPEKNNILLKSGTLTGVYSYAGYFTDDGNLASFAIILNQAQNNRDAILRLLRIIDRESSKTTN